MMLTWNRPWFDSFHRLVHAGGFFVLLAGAASAHAQPSVPLWYSPRSGPPMQVPASRDVLWSQPADLNDYKISSEIIGQFGLETEIADDFRLNVSAVVTNVISWGGYYNWTVGDPPITGLNLVFFDNQGHVPGIVIDEYLSTPLNAQFAGYDGFGSPTYRYETPVAFPAQAGVHYWLVVQACDHPFPPQWGRQGPGYPLHLEPAVFRSEYFGYPNWTGLCGDLMMDCDTSFELQGIGGEGEACCFVNGSCVLLDHDDCVQLGGYPQGEGIVCSPDPCPPVERCCLDDGSCRMRFAEVCEAEGGAPGGPGTDCDPNPCAQAEACCMPDGSCRMLLAAVCAVTGGGPMGPGTDCLPNPCPNQVQACCFDDGSCTMLQPDPCIASGGTPGGLGEDCEPNRCDDPRACCFELGTCRMLLPAPCLEAGGISQGAGVDCSPNPCAPHSLERACCLDDNRCIVAAAAACVSLGGDPMFPGTPCDPDPCSPEPIPHACCFGDGTCLVLLAGECAAQDGLTLGACTTCDPNPCEQPCACCYADGRCELVLATICEAHGGSAQSELGSCDPNPCSGVAIERRSWGRIKALFRISSGDEGKEGRP